MGCSLTRKKHTPASRSEMYIRVLVQDGLVKRDYSIVSIGFSYSIKNDCIFGGLTINTNFKKKSKRLKGKRYKALQLNVLERDNFTCQNCGRHTQAPPHHIIYRSHGGADTMENMITLCGPMEINCHDDVHNARLDIEDVLRERLKWE